MKASLAGPLNDALLESQGVPVVLIIGGVRNEGLTALFSESLYGLTMSGAQSRRVADVPVTSPEPKAKFKTSDITGFGDLGNDWVLEVDGGNEYQVTKLLPMDSGLTLFQLRRVYP